MWIFFAVTFLVPSSSARIFVVSSVWWVFLCPMVRHPECLSPCSSDSFVCSPLFERKHVGATLLHMYYLRTIQCDYSCFAITCSRLLLPRTSKFCPRVLHLDISDVIDLQWFWLELASSNLFNSSNYLFVSNICLFELNTSGNRFNNPSFSSSTRRPSSNRPNFVGWIEYQRRVPETMIPEDTGRNNVHREQCASLNLEQ